MSFHAGQRRENVEKAEPVVRANADSWHFGCGAASGASCRRGSPITFGKRNARESHTTKNQCLVEVVVSAPYDRVWRAMHHRQEVYAQRCWAGCRRSACRLCWPGVLRLWIGGARCHAARTEEGPRSTSF